MAFEDLIAEMSMLLESMTGEPEQDIHDAYERIRQALDTMRAEGLPVPDDLLELEAKLEEAFGQQTGAS